MKICDCEKKFAIVKFAKFSVNFFTFILDLNVDFKIRYIRCAVMKRILLLLVLIVSNSRLTKFEGIVEDLYFV